MPTFTVDRDMTAVKNNTFVPEIVEIFADKSEPNVFYILQGVTGYWVAGGVNRYQGLEAAKTHLTERGVVLAEQISEEPRTSHGDRIGSFGHEFEIWSSSKNSTTK